jgi:hypothetical protein
MVADQDAQPRSAGDHAVLTWTARDGRIAIAELTS